VKQGVGGRAEPVSRGALVVQRCRSRAQPPTRGFPSRGVSYSKALPLPRTPIDPLKGHRRKKRANCKKANKKAYSLRKSQKLVLSETHNFWTLEGYGSKLGLQIYIFKKRADLSSGGCHNSPWSPSYEETVPGFREICTTPSGGPLTGAL